MVANVTRRVPKIRNLMHFIKVKSTLCENVEKLLTLDFVVSNVLFKYFERPKVVFSHSIGHSKITEQ